MPAVADTVKEDCPAAITPLKQLGVDVVMLTGDNARTVASATQVGIGRVFAEARRRRHRPTRKPRRRLGGLTDPPNR